MLLLFFFFFFELLHMLLLLSRGEPVGDLPASLGEGVQLPRALLTPPADSGCLSCTGAVHDDQVTASLQKSPSLAALNTSLDQCLCTCPLGRACPPSL